MNGGHFRIITFMQLAISYQPLPACKVGLFHGKKLGGYCFVFHNRISANVTVVQEFCLQFVGLARMYVNVIELCRETGLECRILAVPETGLALIAFGSI